MIRFSRRALLAGLSAAAVSPARSEAPWPGRPISLVHGYAPGGPTDTVARVLAEGLSRRLGQPVIVEARPGASGTIAAGHVAHAAPDGYTLIAIPGGHATSVAIHRQLPYRPVDDFSMISMISEYPFLIVTQAGHAVRTMTGLIDEARLRRTPLQYGIPGPGSVHHLAIEYLASVANVRFQAVPYRGSALMVPDLIGGRIDFMLDPPTLLLGFVRDGRLRPLGVTGTTRFAGLPDVPTISEAGFPGHVVTSWQGLAGPAGLAAPIIDRLSREVTATLAEPAVIERLRALGNEPSPCSPTQFKARIMADIERWMGVVAAAGIERF